jgi:hemerythrin superfamily protein
LQPKLAGGEFLSKRVIKQSRGSPEQDIYYYLMQDHQEFKDAFQELLADHVPSEDKVNSFITLYDGLMVHTEGEEELFYPALVDGEELTFMVNEAVVEHATARYLAEDITQTEIDDEMWFAKVKVLSTILTHHMNQEEKVMFGRARDVLDDEEALRLADQFMKARGRHIVEA